MRRDRKIKALRDCLGHEAFTKGDELVFYCPRRSCEIYREKEKPKLSVNLVTDHFHCWTCDWGSENLVPIFRMRGGSQHLQEYLDEQVGKREEPVKERIKPELPDGFRPLSNELRSFRRGEALEYLADRGVTSEDVLRWRLGYCESGEYAGRIIFPSFDQHGELNFFVGRSIRKDSFRKYKHPELDKDIVFNDCMIDWTSPIILTEGPFDALKAGDNAIPLQGSSVRTDSLLFRKIVSSGVLVYFALDADVLKKQMRIIQKFRSYGVESRYVRLNGRKDVGEMTHEEFAAAREMSMPIDTSFDLLRARIMS